jgi:hypothetical protein
VDYNAINTAISKAFYKGARIALGCLDEFTTGITTDGVVMWFIPNEAFLFDKGKLIKGDRSYLDVTSYVINNSYKDAVKTEKLVVRDKKTLVIFESGDIEVFVDSKLLKTFDKTATFKIKTPKDPVYIYESDKLVGLVMPSRPPKKEV